MIRSHHYVRHRRVLNSFRKGATDCCSRSVSQQPFSLFRQKHNVKNVACCRVTTRISPFSFPQTASLFSTQSGLEEKNKKNSNEQEENLELNNDEDDFVLQHIPSSAHDTSFSSEIIQENFSSNQSDVISHTLPAISYKP